MTKKATRAQFGYVWLGLQIQQLPARRGLQKKKPLQDPSGGQLAYARLACIIFMAELTSADTSPILLGTTSVVVASVAKRP